MGPFVKTLILKMKTYQQFDYFTFFQGFQTLTCADIGRLPFPQLSQFCQAQKDNLNLKKVFLTGSFSTFVFDQLKQIEILDCGLNLIAKINRLKDMKPHFMLKSIILTYFLQPQFETQIDIETELKTFLENWQRKFPNLKDLFLSGLPLAQLDMIPKQTHHMIKSIGIENTFDIIAENLNIVANSMPNCKNISVRSENDKVVNLRKIVNLENVATFKFIATSCKLNFEDIIHILIQMPKLNDLWIYTDILTSDLSHDDLWELFGNRFKNISKVYLACRKLKDIEYKTIQMLDTSVHPAKYEEK